MDNSYLSSVRTRYTFDVKLFLESYDNINFLKTGGFISCVNNEDFNFLKIMVTNVVGEKYLVRIRGSV